MSLTIYDAAIAVAVIGGMIWGAWRGITWQLASITALVVGYMVAYPASAELAPYLPGEPVVARALGMLIAYAVVAFGVFLVAWSIRTALRRWKFEAFDRHLGMVLGGLEGAFLGIVVTVFVVSVAPDSRGPILTSPSGRVVSRVLSALRPTLPTEVRDVLRPFWGEAEPPRALVGPAIRDRLFGDDDGDRPTIDFGSDQPIDLDAELGDLKDFVRDKADRARRAVAEELEAEARRLGEPDGRPRASQRR